jgi:hypothetical protein
MFLLISIISTLFCTIFPQVYHVPIKDRQLENGTVRYYLIDQVNTFQSKLIPFRVYELDSILHGKKDFQCRS